MTDIAEKKIRNNQRLAQFALLIAFLCGVGGVYFLFQLSSDAVEKISVQISSLHCFLNAALFFIYARTLSPEAYSFRQERNILHFLGVKFPLCVIAVVDLYLATQAAASDVDRVRWSFLLIVPGILGSIFLFRDAETEEENSVEENEESLSPEAVEPGDTELVSILSATILGAGLYGIFFGLWILEIAIGIAYGQFARTGIILNELLGWSDLYLIGSEFFVELTPSLIGVVVSVGLILFIFIGGGYLVSRYMENRFQRDFPYISDEEARYVDNALDEIQAFYATRLETTEGNKNNSIAALGFVGFILVVCALVWVVDDGIRRIFQNMRVGGLSDYIYIDNTGPALIIGLFLSIFIATYLAYVLISLSKNWVLASYLSDENESFQSDHEYLLMRELRSGILSTDENFDSESYILRRFRDQQKSWGQGVICLFLITAVIMALDRNQYVLHTEENLSYSHYFSIERKVLGYDSVEEVLLGCREVDDVLSIDYQFVLENTDEVLFIDYSDAAVLRKKLPREIGLWKSVDNQLREAGTPFTSDTFQPWGQSEQDRFNPDICERELNRLLGEERAAEVMALMKLE